MSKKFLTICLVAGLALSVTGISCTSTKVTELPQEGLHIAVFSDDHVYDKNSLGSTGSALNSYIANDRKMLLESESILDQTLNTISRQKNIKYLLISGDLTKDGEKINHELLASKLQKLEDETGIQVFVINGNHDLSNQDAVRFDGENKVRVETVNRNDFRKIYANFGYNQAVSVHQESLSYSVDLGTDYRLIVIDSCKYNNNKENPHQDTGGEITEATMKWVLEQIDLAKKENRIPLGMMHHGVVPHSGIQPTMFKEYLVDDYEQVMKTFSQAGLNIVFTGHFHSQDAASAEVNGKKFYDIETGSLVTYPCPYRYMSLNGNSLTYTTNNVSDVKGVDIGNYKDFNTYARKFLVDGMYDTYTSFMPGILMSMNLAKDKDSAMELTETILNAEVTKGFTVENLLSEGFAAHYHGKEKMSPRVKNAVSTLKLASVFKKNNKAVYKSLLDVVNTLYKDSPEDDISGTAKI